MFRNAKAFFCCGALSKKTKDTKATDKLNKPEVVINPEPETETKPANGSLYSGITDTAYNLSDWLFGGSKSNEKNENSEDKGNDKKEH